jgi:predicted MFS family arabinose efflux permease
MGIYLLIFMGGTPIGSPLIGFSAEQLGIRPTIMICGTIVAAAGIWLAIALRKHLRDAKDAAASTASLNE